MENDKQNKQFLLLCFNLYVELNVGTVGPTAMRDGPRVEMGNWLKTYIFSSENIPSMQFGHTRAFRFVLYFTVLTITTKSLKFRHAINETNHYLGNLE